MSGYLLNFPNVISEYAEKQMRNNSEVIDAMIIAMRKREHKDLGVLVSTNEDGTVTARLSAQVPYGEVHYAPPGQDQNWAVGPHNIGD